MRKARKMSHLKAGLILVKAGSAGVDDIASMNMQRPFDSGQGSRRCTPGRRVFQALPELQGPRKNGYWPLLAAGEPFRLMFPVGTLIGIFGVLLWPLFHWGAWPWYPGPPHARIMVEGFMAAFVIGFLGTALPRLLEIRRVGLWESVVAALAVIAITIAHALGKTAAGDTGFVVLLVAFAALLAFRARKRRDTPPPAFILVFFGMLSGISGATIQAVVIHGLADPPMILLTLSRLLLYQGFILFPVMGVGAFLLPRFFGMKTRQSFPTSRELPPGWGKACLFATACGLIVLAGFLVEAAGLARLGWCLRAAGFVGFFLREMPLWRASAKGSLSTALLCAVISIPLGYLLMAVIPTHAAGLFHITAISGFGLLTFAVASRVLLGHGGRADRFHTVIRPIRWLTGLMLLAMATRVSADWMPHIQMSHYAYASLTWIVAAAVWAIAMLPLARRADEE